MYSYCLTVALFFLAILHISNPNLLPVNLMKILCCRQILFLDVFHLMTALMRCHSSTPRRASAISFALYLLAIYYLHISVRLPLPSPRSSFTLCQSHSTSTSISFFTSPYIPLPFALFFLSYIIF